MPHRHRATWLYRALLLAPATSWASYAQFRLGPEFTLILYTVIGVLLTPPLILIGLGIRAAFGWRPGAVTRVVLGFCGAIMLVYALLTGIFWGDNLTLERILAAPLGMLLWMGGSILVMLVLAAVGLGLAMAGER